MPDSFSLSNPTNTQPNPTSQPASPAVAPAPSSESNLKLADVVFQQQDAIVFDGTRIPSVKNSQDAFIIFYLTLQDEENGFGTVIQLDPATKQAAIFADLNPEYTYLFYKDEQGQLQTLLWCIEFATRTNDGLYITQAKVHGKGITEADMQHLSQLKMPNAEAGQQHPLPEQDSVMPAQPPQIGADTLVRPTSAPTITPDPASLQTPISASQPTEPISQSAPSFESVAAAVDQPAPSSTSVSAPANQPPASLQAAPSIEPTSTPSSQPAPMSRTEPIGPNQAAAPSDLFTSTTTSSEPALNLPPLPDVPTGPISSPNLEPKPDWNTPRPATPSVADTPSAPQPDWANAPITTSTDTDPLPLPPLPPLPDIPARVTPKSEVSQDSAPAPAGPMPAAFGPATDTTIEPASNQPDQSAQPFAADAAANKNPVGRPPKPLTAEAAWLIEPQDFNWLKSISRDNWSDHQDELRQKLIKQIRKNRPNLIDDWQFHGVLEQAFQAIGQTYDLVPPLRHDLLKSLLNGKIVDQVIKQTRNQ